MNTVITIGRQFGSAGREIGEKVAEYFGIKCFDKDLLTRAAQESGFCEEMIKNHDERPTNSFLYNLVMDTYSFGYNNSSFVDMPISHKVFLAQFDTIKKIADEGPCVIVGRCADYILQEAEPFRIFVYADMPSKMRRCREKGYEKEDLTDRELERRINAVNRSRAEYYEYCTGQKWGDRIHYDLCINTTQGTVKGIAAVVARLFPPRQGEEDK